LKNFKIERSLDLYSPDRISSAWWRSCPAGMFMDRSSKVIGKVANIWIDAHRRHTAPCLALEDRGLTLPRAHLDSDHWARVLRRRWPLDTRRFGGRALVQETAALDPGKRIVASSRRCKTLIVVNPRFMGVCGLLATASTHPQVVMRRLTRSAASRSMIKIVFGPERARRPRLHRLRTVPQDKSTAVHCRLANPHPLPLV